MISIRAARVDDRLALWRILEPVIRAGETNALPRAMSECDAVSYWTGPDRQAFVAEADGNVLGISYLCANQRGGGGHVANGGYMTASHATGQGVARALCEHSMDLAREQGYRAMQFNFVVSTNERAVRLWQSLGFAIVGRLPSAFLHPRYGYTDAFVMFRTL